LSGFSNTTVWLIFGAFMFALGYEVTGLGRRIALVLLAPFTPSNTARSGGTVYPVALDGDDPLRTLTSRAAP
jgi:di/tricarboxylate transporter